MALAGGLTRGDCRPRGGPRSARCRGCKFRGGIPPWHQGPRQDRALSGGGAWTQSYCRLKARSPVGSVPTGAATSRRPWWPRSTISPRSTTRSGSILRSGRSSTRCCAEFVGRPSPISARPAPLGGSRRAGAPQARGPQPHRRPQDQQHGRPGAARAAHGQAPHHRRDRRGAARRRDGDGVRPVRARVRGVHGRGGRAPPGAQRVSACDCSARRWSRSSRAPARSRTRPTRRSATGSPTSPTTHYIIGSVVGPDPYPRMVRDFQAVIGREARAADARAHRAAAAHGRRLRGRRQQRDRHLHRVPGRRRGGAGRRRGRRATGSRAATTARPLSAGTPGVLHGSLSYLLQDADGQVAPAHSISRGAGLSGRRARAQLAARHRPGHATTPSPTRRRWTPSRRSAAWRASSRRWRPRTPSPGCGGPAGAGPPTSRCWCASAGGATRTWPTWPALLGSPV